MTRKSGAEKVKPELEHNTQNVKPDMKKLKDISEKKMKKIYDSVNKNEEQAANKNKDKANNGKEKQTIVGRVSKVKMNPFSSNKKKNSTSPTDKITSSNNANTGSSSHSGSLTAHSNISNGDRDSKHQKVSAQSHIEPSSNHSHLVYPSPSAANVPPPPPTHQPNKPNKRTSSLAGYQPNMNNNGNNASLLASGNTPAHPTELPLSQGMVNADTKNETKINESEYLTFLDTILKQIDDYEAYQNNTRDAIAKIQSEIKQLQQKKDGNASKIKGLQVELYDLLKQVKVTDDDLSTIQKKLAALSGKLSNFPPNSKKSFNKKEPVKSKEDIIAFFKGCWNDVSTEYVIENLFQDQTNIDYALVSVLVEKLIIDYFVKEIFQSPIYMDFKEINSAYQTIEGLFKEAGHDEWNSNLRLRCVKTTLTEIERDPGVAEESKNSRTKLCNKLLEKLSAIYDVNDITPRIKKLVDMACDLSFPMNSQEERIKIRDLRPDEPFYTNQVKAQYGSDKSPDTVRLGISPVFLIKNSIHFDEDDDMNMEYDDGHSFNGDNNYDYDDDDDDDEDGEEKEKPNIGFYEDNHYTLVYAGRAIGCNERAKLDEQTKIEVDM